MSKLEKTLIHSAELELQMLVSFTHTPDGDEQLNCFQRINALVMLAYLQDSGLSEEGIAALERIEKAANDLIAKERHDAQAVE